MGVEGNGVRGRSEEAREKDSPWICYSGMGDDCGRAPGKLIVNRGLLARVLTLTQKTSTGKIQKVALRKVVAKL
jgi:hypothetical protein